MYMYIQASAWHTYMYFEFFQKSNPGYTASKKCMPLRFVGINHNEIFSPIEGQDNCSIFEMLPYFYQKKTA